MGLDLASVDRRDLGMERPTSRWIGGVESLLIRGVAPGCPKVVIG